MTRPAPRQDLHGRRDPRRGVRQALLSWLLGRETAPALGPWGEARVAEEYSKRGATVLARNFRCREGELDLVVLDRGVLAAVEVKTRTLDRQGALPAGRPAESVTASRITRLERALVAYQALRGEPDAPLRIDVAEVIVDCARTVREIRILHNVTG